MAESFAILTGLPEVIGRQVLVEWLTLSDVVRLDSAYCHRAQLANFAMLAYNSHTQYALANTDSVVNSFDSIAVWSRLKGARLNCVCLTRRLVEDTDLRSAFLSINQRAVKSMILHDSLLKLPYEQYHDVILHITRSCPNIVDMNYNLCRPRFHNELLTTSVRDLMREGLGQAVSNCVHLEQLDLCFPGEVPQSVACPALKSLTVTGACSEVRDSLLVALGRHSPQLEYLRYSFGRLFGGRLSITEAGVEALLQGCPLLHDSNIHVVTDLRPDLRIELARRANYEVLNLSQWRGMTTGLLEDILRVSPSLTKLFCSEQQYVEDSTLAVCADHCPRLETIILSGCRGVTSDGLRTFLSQAGSTLEHINICDTPQLGDDAVLVIAAHCPLLKRFQSPRGVSDEAIMALAEGCPQLRIVELQHTAVSAGGIAALAQHCPGLTTLQLDGCDHLTLQCVSILEAHCPTLTHVMLPDTLWQGSTPLVVQRLVTRGVQVTAFHRLLRVNPPVAEPQMEPSVTAAEWGKPKTAATAKNCCLS